MGNIKTDVAKIDKDGVLFVSRYGRLQLQYCPFHGSDDYCGIWCPLFGTVSDLGQNCKDSYRYLITLCHGEVRAETFICELAPERNR